MISSLLTAMFSARRTRTSSNGFWSTRIAMNVPLMAATCSTSDRGALFFSCVDVLPADRLQDVELAGAQRGDPRRLVLDDAVDDLVDERQLELLPLIVSLSQ